MAEFCYKCMEEVLGYDLSNKKAVLSKHLELCEGCAEYKYVVLDIREKTLFDIILSKLKNNKK